LRYHLVLQQLWKIKNNSLNFLCKTKDSGGDIEEEKGRRERSL
jgi:hypothetical protein